MGLLQVVGVACVLLACACAVPLIAVGQEPEPFDANPQYSYSYNIQDAVTGDSKGHSETRNGDVVQGQYSVLDADGTRRIVDYTADPVHGFNAVVRREGTPSVHAIPAPVVRSPVVARAIAPAPANVLRTAPAPFVQYSNPRFSYSVQPVASYASAPAAVAAAAAPAHYRLPSFNVAGPSNVHTSVSTPYHSYSY